MIALALLPALLSPAPPFPHIVTNSASIEPVAPGVTYGEYDLTTTDGPIVVRAVEIQPHRSDVAIRTVLAGDALTSAGETVSSMAKRTQAVAGINGDYFDIGNTNRPTNIVVRDGALERTPRKRYALIVGRDGTPHFAEERFTGTVQIGDRTVALAGVNEMPPPGGGIALLTPSFGAVPPADNVTLVALSSVFGATPPFGSYRVLSIADNLSRQPAGYYLAIGLNAYAAAGVPDAGDTIVAGGDLAPIDLSSISTAVGGGPMILRDGNLFDDFDGPRGGEYDARIPSSGAAIEADGSLLLLQVDGRQPDESIGVTRPEFASLMRALGATDGIAFDGGGSSELAVRALGDAGATLANAPSDGIERPVANGIFVYSNAPLGAAAQLVARPSVVRAVPGARVAVSTAAVDAADHLVASPSAVTQAQVQPASLGSFDGTVFVARAPGDGAIVVRNGALTARVPVHVIEDPARLIVEPQHPAVAIGGRITLRAIAFDASGAPVALPDALPWRAAQGRIEPDGSFTAGSQNALISLLVGDHLANVQVVVGSHDVPIDVLGAHFMTVPANGAGGVTPGATCPGCLALHYALGPAERAAYAVFEHVLPAVTTGLRFEIQDDGSGARVKIALRNAINEEVLINAATLDHPGWRTVDVAFPASLAQPARLVGIYVIDARPSAGASGTVIIRNLHAVAAGSEPPK